MVHGRGAVIRATGIQHRHLTEKVASKVQEAEVRKPRIADVSGERVKVINAAPFYSRIEFPVAPTRPLAEAETRSGFKVRVFAITPETIGLLSVLSRLGRAL